MIWDKATTDHLQACVERGMSGSQIAHELGATRCSVISKCIRMGFRLQRIQSRKKIRRPRPRIIVDCSYNKSAVLPMPVLLPEKLIPLLDLRPHHCRFPYGDPDKPGFGFCGNDVVPERSYCAGHLQVAYRPMKPYQRRRS